MNQDGFEQDYLFGDSDACCAKWYPALGSDCPHNGPAVNPEAEDEPWNADKYPMNNYYFPDFSKNSCGFGWDYPNWMGINGYEKHYLFTEGKTCCERFFATSSAPCPYEDTVQTGYYWESYQEHLANEDDMPIKYNHTYYPDRNAGTCVNGTDYPEYMGSDKEFIRLYLFKNLEGCCKHWFGSDATNLADCENNVIQGKYEIEPCPTNRPDCNHTSSVTNTTAELLTMWYPSMDEGKCKNDGNMPSYMLLEDYTDWYLFNDKERCCAAFGRSGWSC